MATLPSLPLELLRAIASKLKKQRYLGTFVRTNRHLYLSLNAYLYCCNNEHFWGSALIWGVRQDQIRTVEYSIQEGGNVQRSDGRGYSPLETAIYTNNYAMIKLLVENRAVERDPYLCGRALSMIIDDNCHKILRKRSPYTEAESKVLWSVKRMGHEELVDLVNRKDQEEVKDIYSPVWPTLAEAVSVCETRVSIIRLLLENRVGGPDEPPPERILEILEKGSEGGL
jgi:hypothetical protein